MKDMYRNLSDACEIFTDEYDLSIDQNYSVLKLSISQGYINLDELKKELLAALSDLDFDWLEFAKSSKLLVNNIGKYDSDKVKAYVKSLLWSFLFGE